ncbi:MAG: CotH kinase family protein [Aureliella sp.]
MRPRWLCLLVLAVTAVNAAAQQQASNPLQSLLISPDGLIRQRAELGLSAVQVQQIQSLLKAMEQPMQRLQQQANDLMGRLTESLSRGNGDTDATLALLDQFLTIEKEQRVIHFRTMILARTLLTASQRQSALESEHSRNPNDGMQQRLHAKLIRIQTELQSRAQAGVPPMEAIELMQKFSSLMQNGQARESEQLLDRILVMLRIDMADGLQSHQSPMPPKPKKDLVPPRPIDATLSAANLDDSQAQTEFYRLDEVQTIQLRIAADDMQRLLEALPERIYVRGSFQWRDLILDNVAVRFKGNSSSNPQQRHKRSFLIKFNEYDKEARFIGLRRASFDNGVQFGSLFSEPIITKILRDQGIPTHRTNYARVFVNDEYQGVYVNVERMDESFLQRNLPDPNGALFKADIGGPGGNLQFVGNDPAAYEKAFEAESVEAKRSRAQLVEFIRMINQTESNEFAASLESSMELEDFLKVTAVMLFAGAFDQLTGGAPHNYYLYHNAMSDRWRYLPWDLDVGFCETAFGQIRVLDDWDAAWPLAPSGGPNPLMERIAADPALLERYRQIARTILEEYFEPERLCGIIDANYKLIREDLQSDPFPHQRAVVPGEQGYDAIVESIKTFMRKRFSRALQQLDNPGPQPEILTTRNE